MTTIVLYNPINGEYLKDENTFVEDENAARIFESILEADSYSAWFESTTGVQLYAKRHFRKGEVR